MKKQYIAPSMFAVKLQAVSIIAESAGINGTPEGDFNNPGSGNAGDAATKGSTNIWDEEW